MKKVQPIIFFFHWAERGGFSRSSSSCVEFTALYRSTRSAGSTEEHPTHHKPHPRGGILSLPCWIHRAKDTRTLRALTRRVDPGVWGAGVENSLWVCRVCRNSNCKLGFIIRAPGTGTQFFTYFLNAGLNSDWELFWALFKQGNSTFQQVWINF